MGTVRTARAEWIDRVRDWRASGLSCREYASELGIKPQTLSWWRWKLERDGEDLRVGDHSGQRPLPAKFVEFEVEQSAAQDATTARALPIEMIVGNVTLRLPVDFDGMCLERLLDVLEARG